MIDAVDDPRRSAARVVGVCYLFAMAAAIFSESYLRGTLIVPEDAMATARHLVAHKALFRLSIATEIVTFLADVTLITALYVILSPISRPLALYATLLRMAAVCVCFMIPVSGFDALRILNGAPYMAAFTPEQLAALARVSIGSHSAAYGVAFILLGAGSTVFACLWLRSHLVPRGLAVLGLVGSPLLAAGSFATLMSPSLGPVLYPWHMLPLFFFEVGMGLWLLARGLRSPPAAPPA